jgi:hypothetical protein
MTATRALHHLQRARATKPTNAFAGQAAALGGLVVYDTVSVYGTGGLVAPAAAAAAAAAGGAEASQSVMEAVARAKLGGPWQPGLLSVVVGGKTTDALGLGDAVFPSMLAGWALRKDAAAQAVPRGEVRVTEAAAGNGSSEGVGVAGRGQRAAGGGYFSASLGGYCLGCFLCEVTNSGGGQPALLLLVPSMFAAVFAKAASRGELASIWRP